MGRIIPTMRAKNVAILESRLGAQLAELVRSLEAQPAKLAVFQTGVGTRALFAATDDLGLSARLLSLLEKMLVVVRGPKPSGTLRARAVRIDRSAAEPYTTHEVLESIQDMALQGARVIVQRHGSVNVELDRALEARGASVVEIPTYRWSLPADTAPLACLIGSIERGEMHAVVLTNAEQVRNLFAVAGQLGRADALRAGLNRTLVASIGPVASAALREAGVRVGLESHPPKLGALLSSLDKALS